MMWPLLRYHQSICLQAQAKTKKVSVIYVVLADVDSDVYRVQLTCFTAGAICCVVSR